MIGKFHDSSYEGIVLKIPSVFIAVNGIGGQIDELLKVLEKCDKCKYLPDNLNNIYELGNYANKTEIKKSIDAELNQRRALKEQREADILSGKIILLEYKKQSVVSDYDTLEIGKTDFTFKDYFTEKLSVKKAFIDSVYKEHNTIEKFITFINRNFSYARHLVSNSNEKTFKWMDTTFSAAHGANLKCTLNILYTQTIKGKSKKGGLVYYNELLEFDDKGYYVSRGNNKVYFEGYEYKNMELVKKK